jgi:hypothetical protein
MARVISEVIKLFRDLFRAGSDFVYALMLACWMLSADCSLERVLDGIKGLWGDRANDQIVQQEPQLLRADVEVLYVEFERQMHLQYQLTVFSREILKLPTLPEEGY